jgi:DNA polymerase-3 subunit alpha
LLVELPVDQAGDITIQHRLRECLQRHRLGQDEAGVRVPVIARVRDADRSRYVRLGSQFCVADGASALHTLESAAFQVSLLSPLQEAGAEGTPALATVAA